MGQNVASNARKNIKEREVWMEFKSDFNLQRKSSLVYGFIMFCHESGSWSSIHSPSEVALTSYWLSHHTDCCTSHWTPFPIIHCTDYTAESHQTHFISLGHPLSHHRVYVLVFSTLLVLAALPSHSGFLFSLQCCSVCITHLVIAALLSLVSCST